MIIANGTIESKRITGGGVNHATGYANNPSVTWGESIPCQYRANTRNNQGRVNGEAFTIASYVIFIEDMTFNAESLRLKDSEGSTLGDFSVIELKKLDAVNQLKILV